MRGQLVDLRGADLRFDTDEAGGLLGSAAHLLDRDLLDQLCGRTEGWAAGLVLAGLSLKRTTEPGRFIEAFRGDDRLVVEYLRDELLAAVDADHRRRLLETSILRQLSGALVDAVTGESGGAKWLNDTASINQLLIGLDHNGTWFRYHHLFRDLLRLEAHQTFPDRIPDLHARAALWFESQGDHGQAIVHRVAAGDLDAAAQLLLVLGPRLLMNGQIDTLRGLLEQLGDAAQKFTWCALLYGWCEYIDGRYSRAEAWLDIMREVAPAGSDETVATSLRMNISLARGDVATALDQARQVSATDKLATHAEKAAVEQFPTAHVLALVYRAIVELDDGSAATAQRAASTALEAARRFGLAAYHGVAPAYAIRARTGSGTADVRADALHALALARRASTDLGLGYVLTTCGDTLIDLGDSVGVSLLAEARSVIARCPDPGVVGRYLARAESRHGSADSIGSSVAILIEQLTARELAVLRYLPTNRSQRDIAAELFVSLNTVKTHCRAIYRKLGVGDRKAAVQAARDVHLL